MIIKKLLDKYWFSWLFFFIILILYLVISLINISWWLSVAKYFFTILIWTIFPVLILVYFLIFIFNLIIDKDYIKNFLKKWNYFSKLILSVVWGILSSWPVYLWYPLLKKFKQQWITDWHIASFIYARAIKIPLLLMMVSFFWLKYTLIFNLVVFVFAFIIWIIIDFI